MKCLRQLWCSRNKWESEQCKQGPWRLVRFSTRRLQQQTSPLKQNFTLPGGKIKLSQTHIEMKTLAPPSLRRYHSGQKKKKMSFADSFTHLRRLPTWAPCWVPPVTKTKFWLLSSSRRKRRPDIKCKISIPTLEWCFFVSCLEVVEHTVGSEEWLRRELKGVV